MKKIILLICCGSLLGTELSAQNKTILLEPQTRKINQGSPLPSQSSFDIQVPVSKETGIIRINVFKGNKATDIIERALWTRPVDFTGDFAELPIDLKLRNSNKYGFDVSIFVLLTDTEKNNLKESIHQNLSNYLNATIEANSKGLEVDKNITKTVQDLNAVIRRSLTYYNNTEQRQFEGYSDIVGLKLKQLTNARLSNANFNITKTAGDSSKSTDDFKAIYANQLKNELLQVVFNETDNYLNLNFVRLHDSFLITNRVTERSQTVLPLFVGYGGVYLGGSVNDLEYDSQPYAGFSFPLGRGNENHYGRTSFILGIFLANFKDGAGNIITGPIVDRPVFTGLGFRIYDFINLNAGIVATSTEKQNLSNIKTTDIQLKPFVGLNAQFNLWLGLNKK